MERRSRRKLDLLNEGMRTHFACIDDIGKTKLSERFYRRYIFIDGQWTFQGVFQGTDRFTKQLEDL